MGFIRAAIIAQIILASASIGTSTATQAAPAAATPAAVPTKRILIYGDSLSAGYDLQLGAGFAPQLERALKKYGQKRGQKIKIINASLSGETTSGGWRRLRWTLKSHPAIDIVILELGANDALRAQSPTKTKTNLNKMLNIFKERNIAVLLAGLRAPPNYGKPYTQAFDNIYPALSSKHGARLYPFFLDGVAGNPAFNLPDGIHPNARGVKIIVANILPSVLKMLEDIK